MSDTVSAYCIVSALGIAVGIAETISTFPASPTEALKTAWAFGLVLLNAVVAALVLAIVFMYAAQMRTTLNPLLTALAVGFGLPTLVRTKFTIAKQFGGGDGNDLSINLGWLYDQLLYLCKIEIDLALVKRRQKPIQALLDKYPELDRLKELADRVITERALFTQEDVQRRQAYVDAVYQGTISLAAKKVALARFIFETGGRDYMEALSAGVGK
jgi:hypothetical protein